MGEPLRAAIAQRLAARFPCVRVAADNEAVFQSILDKSPLPLWLVGMPLAAWWSLRGFPLPDVALRLPRRRRAQAHRRRMHRAMSPLRAARRA